MILLAPPQPSSPTASQILERIVGAHARLTSFEARVDHPLPKGSKAKIPSPSVSREGDKMRLRILDVGARPFPTVRTFGVQGSLGFAYDDVLNEYVAVRRSGGTPYARLSGLIGSSDLVVSLLMEPTLLATFLRDLEKVKGWTVRPGELTLKEKGAVTRIGYDPRTSLLTSIRAGAGKEAFEARYVYAKNGLRAWAPPAGARRVPFASNLAGALTFRDAAARQVAERMVRRNAQIVSGRVLISGDNAATIDAAGGAIRQRGQRLETVYANGVLAIRNLKTGKLFRGRAKPSDVRNIAGKLGEPLVPVAQAMLSRRLVFANLFVPPRQARVKGKITLGSVPCDILDLVGPHVRTTLFVDPAGRIVSLEAEARDRGGRIIELVRQKLTYGPAQPIRTPAGAAASLPR